MDGKTLEKKDMDATTNRISVLPDAVIHCIWSFLSSKEAVRTSVLSKAWLSAWCTNPILEFIQTNYFDKLRFVKLVDQTLSRYQEQNIPVDTFRLHAAMQQNLSTFDVYKWIQISIENGVKVLSLLFSPKLSYSLPHSVFASKTLIELDLSQCKLELSGLNINFCSLRKLHLKRVHLDEHMIEKLLSSIPLIQVFTLYLCKGFKNIKVANLDSLKFFEIGVMEQMERVEIDSPSLQSLPYSINEWNTTFDHLDIHSTQNVKRFKF